MKLRISEIFGPTLQGEGALIGTPTLFIRLGGCDYRCHWCDTLYAVLPEHKNEWAPMSVPSIMQKVFDLSHERPMLVTISGGNPALYNLEPLLLELKRNHYKTSLETQGSVARDWFKHLDYLTVSPKPPSAATRTRDRVFDCLWAYQVHTKNGASLKVPIFTREDFLWAKEFFRNYVHIDKYLSVGNPMNGDDTLDRMKQILEWLVNDDNMVEWGVKLLPQLHVLLWGNKRGV